MYRGEYVCCLQRDKFILLQGCKEFSQEVRIRRAQPKLYVCKKKLISNFVSVSSCYDIHKINPY